MSVKKLSVKKIKAIKGGDTHCTASNWVLVNGKRVYGTGGQCA